MVEVKRNRHDDESAVHHIKAIRLGARAGFTLAELRSAREEQRGLSRAHELLEAIERCRCTRLSDCRLLAAK